MKEYKPKVLREVDATYLVPLVTIMYAIGEQHKPYEFGMWRGPSLDEKEMLEICGKSNKSCIIRFDKDGTNEVIWRWEDGRKLKDGKWLSVEE